MSSLLPTTLLPSSPNPPSSPMRSWCTAWAQAWHPPPIHITSRSILHQWLLPKSHSQAHVSVVHAAVFTSEYTRWTCTSRTHGDTLRPINVRLVVCPAPRSKRRGCCKSNSQCYGGSGGVLLLIALLALAIWLGGRLCLFIMSLELICFSNSCIAMIMAYKEYYVIHNTFCDIVVLIKPFF